MSKEMKIVMFPPNLIKLREILFLKHKDIVTKLNPGQPIEEALAQICTELGIAVDGLYEVDDLCEMILWELDAKERQQLGLPSKMRYRGLKMIQTEIELEVTAKKEPEKEPGFASGIESLNVDKSTDISEQEPE